MLDSFTHEAVEIITGLFTEILQLLKRSSNLSEFEAVLRACSSWLSV